MPAVLSVLLSLLWSMPALSNTPTVVELEVEERSGSSPGRLLLTCGVNPSQSEQDFPRSLLDSGFGPTFGTLT